MPRGVRPGYTKKWTAEYKAAYMRVYRIIRTYGVSADEAKSLAERASSGACDICGESATGSRKHHVDHDHTTGVVRGVLCHGCNTGLGLFRENPILMTKAGRYLGNSVPLPIDTLQGV